ncbi:hypothetical protein RHIZO_02376 [Rhizobiaceae bacterium]|nr:hypothetical protein RHIZO_02376 [Rhizobiaceae bacterium]
MARAVQKRVSAAKEPTRPASRRTCVVVLGMHRSGTSALSRVLSLLGCDLPKTLMPPSPANEPGHWESMAMYKLNDRILESAGSAWHDWLELNPKWFDSPKADEFREEATVALAEEFGSSRLFVLKDPRICRLFPFWLDVLQRSDVLPLVWVPLRNPLEVAGSLEKRNGFEPALSNLLWLRNVLDAEAASRGARRVFSTYDQLVNGWARVAKRAENILGVNWPRFSERAASEIESFLSDGHRHHQDHPDDVLENPSLSAWVRETFAILTRWAETGEDLKDRPTLDRIRGEFNAAAPAFARLIADGRAAGAKAASLEKALAASASRIETAQLENAAKDQKIRQAEQELASTRDRIAEREKALSELRAELEKRAAHLAQERERAGKLETEIAALKTRATTAESGIAEREKALSELRAELARRDAALTQERERSGRLGTEIEGFGARATAAEQSVSALRDEVMRRRQEVERIEEGKASAERNLASLRNELEAKTAATAEAERRFVEMRDRLSETQSALRQRSLEAEQTAAELAHARAELEHGAVLRAEADKIAERLHDHIRDLKADIHARQSAFEALESSSRDLHHQLDAANRRALEAGARLAEAETEARTRYEDLAAELIGLRDERREIEAARDEGVKVIAGLKEHVVFLTADITRLKAEVARQADDYRRTERTKDDEIVRVRAELDRLTVETDAIRKQAAEAERSKIEAGKATAGLDAELARMKSENQRLRSVQADAERKAQDEKSRLEQRLGERFSEIASLTKMYSEAERRVYVKDEKIASMRDAVAQEMGKTVAALLDSRTWRFVPGRVRIFWQMALLRRTGLFDAKWYLKTYKDVAEAAADPLRHYVAHGALEGREPNSTLAELKRAASEE